VPAFAPLECADLAPASQNGDLVQLTSSSERHQIAASLPRFSAASLAGKIVPPRRWLVHEMVPDQAVTILAGDGATGKSTLALQLAVSVVTGKEWIGQLPDQGQSYLSVQKMIRTNCTGDWP
jgi:hypothetical protein